MILKKTRKIQFNFRFLLNHKWSGYFLLIKSEFLAHFYKNIEACLYGDDQPGPRHLADAGVTILIPGLDQEHVS